MDWKDPWKDCTVDGIATVGCLPVLFNLFIRAALVFGGIIAVFLIIYAGINMGTSSGDPKKIEGAKRMMTFAIIGLIIVLLSFAILLFIGFVTNSTDCITSILDVDKFITGCQ